MLKLIVILPLFIVALFTAGFVWDWCHSNGFRHYQSTWHVLWRIQAAIAIVVMLAIAAYGLWFNGTPPR
jgi:hypothetical protein